MRTNGPLRNDTGATGVEYGILAAAIAAVIIAAAFLLGGEVLGLFTDTHDEIVANF